MALLAPPRVPVPALLKLPRSDSPVIEVGCVEPLPSWPAEPLPARPPPLLPPPNELPPLPPLDPLPLDPLPPSWANAAPEIHSQVAASPTPLRIRIRVRMVHLSPSATEAHLYYRRLSSPGRENFMRNESRPPSGETLADGLYCRRWARVATMRGSPCTWASSAPFCTTCRSRKCSRSLRTSASP